MSGKQRRASSLGAVAVMVGAGVLALSGMAWGQAPRYQSPYVTAPVAPTLPTPPAITPNGTVVEDVVVKVNDNIISRSDVERSEQQLQQEMQQQNVSPEERAQREKDMLRDMIDQQLLLSRAKELGLNADAEVVRRLDEIRKQNHLDSLEALEKAAAQQGVSYADFKANIRNGVLTQQVVRDEVGRRLQMTQGQEQAYYDAHKAEFEQPEQERLSEILVPLPADADEAALAQAKAKAEGLEAKIIGGASFESVAKESSGGPTAAQGGDLGEFKRGALAKVLEDQTFSLKAGQITQPIRTKQGFVILKVTAHQDAGIPPIKQVEPQIQEALYMSEMQPALRAYLTKLREDAYIDIKPGYVDSGASPNQTKLVFSAYAPPVVKKKKVVQKARFERAPVGGASAATTSTTGIPALPAASTGTGAAGVSGAAGSGAVASGESATTGGAAGSESSAAGTGKVRASKRQVDRPAKRKRIHREKVRYGQAPRNAIPAGPKDMASGQDVGAGAESATATPGAVMAPTGTTTEISSTSDPDPLAPKVRSTGKTRFSDRAFEEKEKKVKTKTAKQQEKILAKPVGPTTEEAAAQKEQSAPLGLNGDTATKKKVKRKKGEAKERLQGKAKVDPNAGLTPISPTVNPNLGASPEGTTPAQPTSNTTTLPPVTAPAPGASPTGQPLSPTGSPATTPNGTSEPPVPR